MNDTLNYYLNITPQTGHLPKNAIYPEFPSFLIRRTATLTPPKLASVLQRSTEY